MKLKLYIGAHKTATTHVQRLLAANRQELSDNKIHLSIPSDIRPLWFPFLREYASSDDSAAIKKILSNSPTSGTWIFAEENVSGVPYDLKVKPGIYPSLSANLAVFKELFPDAELDVFFSIRSYDSFYASSYLEVVRNRGFFPFEEYYDECRYAENSWYHVIRTIIETVGSQDRLTLWCYEEFSSLLPSILSKLTGLDDAHALKMASDYEVDRTRQSISQKTLNIIEALSPMETLARSRQVLESLNDKFPASAGNGYFKPFSQSQVKGFRVQYDEDILRILKNFPNANFLNKNS